MTVLHALLLYCCPQAQELASLLRHYSLMSHVNLIPWNPVDDSPYKRPGSGKVWPGEGGFVFDQHVALCRTVPQLYTGWQAACKCLIWPKCVGEEQNTTMQAG